MTGQILIGGMSSIFGPAICAISLGVVGRELFDRRQGRNQTFNSAGNVVAAVAMGLIGYFIANRGIFLFVVVLAIPTLVALRSIRADQIDYNLARGANVGDAPKASERVLDLFKDHPLVVFLVCAVMFHFANAAMLPLLGEMLSKGHGRRSMAFMSACVVTTQVVVTLLASWCAIKAGQWGRKPLLLIAFAALPIRGILYTLTDNTELLVAIQVLDGVAAAIFGVVSVLVIADLTKGSGRFNLTLGVFLAAVAAAALAILFFFMPETHDSRKA
jgi:predicted MFS family arabinose efflux permease